jgi:hypothetical protein
MFSEEYPVSEIQCESHNIAHRLRKDATFGPGKPKPIAEDTVDVAE